MRAEINTVMSFEDIKTLTKNIFWYMIIGISIDFIKRYVLMSLPRFVMAGKKPVYCGKSAIREILLKV